MYNTVGSIPVCLRPIALPDKLRARLRFLLEKAQVTSCILDSFAIKEQCQNNWCWAAVTICVLDFFSPQDDDSCLLQCRLVNEIRCREDCCLNGDSDDCDVPWPTNLSLEKLELLEEFLPRLMTFKEIKRELGGENCKGGKPVGCGLDGRESDASHAAVIIGWCEVDQKEKIFVCDPDGPEEDWLVYDDFLQDDKWVWARTYRTKEP